MAEKQTKRWDQYVEEARIPPFEIVVSDEETLVIEAPTGVALERYAEGARKGDLALVMWALVGDHWDRIRELLGKPGTSHKAMRNLIEDLCDHFQLYEPVTFVGPSGGKKTVTRPTEMQRLVDMGWRPAMGEAQSS